MLMTLPELDAALPSASREGLLEHAWVDRDLSWLEFNRRVLHEALDERTPLLERVKFLAIFTANLDEFYMKRVGILRGKVRAEQHQPAALAGASRQRLARIRSTVLEMLEQQARCFTDVLRPALAQQGIVLARWHQLSAGQKDEAARYFDSNVSPALTPLGFDPAHPFPFISNRSTNWGFVLREPDSGEYVPVRVKIPGVLPQWVPLKADAAPGERWFLSLNELIRHNAIKLFPGMEITGDTLFRILRNAEVDLDDEESENVREAVTEGLRQRRFQPVVRIDFARDPFPEVRRALMQQFELTDEDVYELPGLLDYTGLAQIAALDIPALRDAHFLPCPPPRLRDQDADLFAAIQAGDLLVHHPYESFDASVERFIEQAADDPQTVAIKMTVYRVGDDTPFVRSLIRAAEAGKQVACVIELKARFDEARNLQWAEALQRVGAHVVYGVLGLKTHPKVALAVRSEAHGLRCYAHIGTGNYHVKTARLYTDVGLFTCDPQITADVVNLFHYLTGRSRSPTFASMLVAPLNMRERFLQMIDREIAHHHAGRSARIVAKVNQVEDLEVCQALVAASRAGVQVDLIVRGLCCLVPGVPGWTDNVRVRSIVGRFLEHSRIFYFANGADHPAAGEYYIGSGDWMFRNLSRRVEAAAPVKERALRQRLWEVLEACLRDERQAWEMRADGSYVQQQPADPAGGVAAMGVQAWLIESTRRRAAASG
jgi:polyphosphate kinase